MFSSFKRKSTGKAESNLGCSSMLVLAKLGFDMRGHYEDLISEPLPEEFSRMLAVLENGERA